MLERPKTLASAGESTAGSVGNTTQNRLPVQTESPPASRRLIPTETRPVVAPEVLQSHPAAMNGQLGKTDLQTSTNFSGSSGEKPMALKRPDVFLSKTCGHKSQKSIFIPHISLKSIFVPHIRRFQPPRTDGRSLTAWISSIGRTTV